MKTILASMRPGPLSLICDFKKMWEVRKHSPKTGTPFRVLCCESGSHGMIKASFVCDTIVKKYPHEALTELEQSCVPYESAVAYANGEMLHFWHISELKVYDDHCGFFTTDVDVKRPPQSWQYIHTANEQEEHI